MSNLSTESHVAVLAAVQPQDATRKQKLDEGEEGEGGGGCFLQHGVCSRRGVCSQRSGDERGIVAGAG